MQLIDLIKFDQPVYRPYSDPESPYIIKNILKLAREQGVLSEICLRLGISLRSTQRWIPTRKVPIKSEKIHIVGGKAYEPLFYNKDTPEYELAMRKRKNKKKKSLNINKNIKRLLDLTLLGKEPIPDKEPTDKEIMELLLKFKKSVGTWRKVSEQLYTFDEMVLYRFRKTKKMRKCNRILLYMLLNGRFSCPVPNT